MSYARPSLGCRCKQASGGCDCRDSSLGVVPSLSTQPVNTGTSFLPVPVTRPKPGSLVVSPVVSSNPSTRTVRTQPVATAPRVLALVPSNVSAPPPNTVNPVLSTAPIYQAAHQAAVTGDGDTAAQLASLATSIDQAAQSTGTPTSPPPVPVVPDTSSSSVSPSLLPLVAIYGVIALALLYVSKRKY